MKWNEYLQRFDDILEKRMTGEPYTDESYVEYTRLNKSRVHRWIKTVTLLDTTVEALQSIKEHQQWVVISEPWCGDAAHILPILQKMVEVNPFIDMDIQLRDTESEIENYLYKGTKSIPVLIIRDANGRDKAVWGPRPKSCQLLVEQLKSEQKTKEEEKLAVQQWYNENKGLQVQKEIIELLRSNN